MNEYEIFENENGTWSISGPHGLVGGVFIMRENAEKYAEDLSGGKVTDPEIPSELPEPEPEVVEEIVSKSGVRMWLPRSWREQILDHKRITLVAFLVVVIAAGSIIGLGVSINRNDALESKIGVLQTDNKILEEDNKSLEAEATTKDGKIFACQQSLETAWKAWDRRNQLFITVLRNAFGENSEAISADNSQSALDFVTGKEQCSPGMDSTQIFTPLE